MDKDRQTGRTTKALKEAMQFKSENMKTRVLYFVPTRAHVFNEVMAIAVALDPEGKTPLEVAYDHNPLLGKTNVKVFYDHTWNEYASPEQKQRVKEALTAIETRKSNNGDLDELPENYG